MKRDLYLSIPFIEALGNAAVAISELELSFDILVSILTREPGIHGYCDPRDSFERKIEYLATRSHSQLLKHEWWRTLRNTAERAKVVQKQFKSAAMATVYSRGAGRLEQNLRELADETGVSPGLNAKTPGKVNEVGEEARQLAFATCQLAASLLTAARKLSIDLAGASNSSEGKLPEN